MLTPIAAPAKRSEGKCAWSGRRVSATNAAAPKATQGTHRCYRYRAEITVATANAEAAWPDGKLPPFEIVPLY